MEFTENNKSGFTLNGVENTTICKNGEVSLTYNEMWEIYQHMKKINIRRQIEDYLHMHLHQMLQFSGRVVNNAKPVKEILADKILLNAWVEYIYNDDFDDFCEEYLVDTLEDVYAEL